MFVSGSPQWLRYTHIGQTLGASGLDTHTYWPNSGSQWLRHTHTLAQLGASGLDTHTHTHTLAQLGARPGRSYVLQSHQFFFSNIHLGVTGNLSPVRENPESAACWSEGGAEVQEVRGSSGSSGDVSKSERYVLREVLD